MKMQGFFYRISDRMFSTTNIFPYLPGLFYFLETAERLAGSGLDGL